MKTYLEEATAALRALNESECKYMIIGGAAVNIHGFTRSTGDLDIWYKSSEENLDCLFKSIDMLGYDSSELRANKEKVKMHLTRLPIETMYIEFLPFIDRAMDFDEIYKRAENFEVNTALTVKVISYDDLIESKIRARRPKDLEDIAQLTRRKLL